MDSRGVYSSVVARDIIKDTFLLLLPGHFFEATASAPIVAAARSVCGGYGLFVDFVLISVDAHVGGEGLRWGVLMIPLSVKSYHVAFFHIVGSGLAIGIDGQVCGVEQVGNIAALDEGEGLHVTCDYSR